MIKVPAQHQTDPEKQAGQVVSPEYKPSHGGRSDKTLGDYLNRRYPEQMKKKLTFDEWGDIKEIQEDVECIDFYYHALVWSLLEQCWKVAQENK